MKNAIARAKKYAAKNNEPVYIVRENFELALYLEWEYDTFAIDYRLCLAIVYPGGEVERYD